MRSKVGRASATGRRLSSVRLVSTPLAPLVSVLLAVNDGERFLRQAVTSVLRQTVDGPRADRRRRRVERRDTGDPRGARRSPARRPPERRAAGPRALAERCARPRSGRLRGAARRRRRRAARPSRAPACARRARTRASLSSAAPSSSSTTSDQPRCAARHAAGGSQVRWRRALQLAVLPPDRARRPRSSRGARSPLRRRSSSRARTTTSGRGSSPVADGDNLAEPLVLYRTHPGQASQRAPRRPARLPAPRRAARDRARRAGALAGRARACLAHRRRRAASSPTSSRTRSDAFVALVERVRAAGGTGIRERAARALGRAARGARPARPAREQVPARSQLDPAHAALDGARPRPPRLRRSRSRVAERRRALAAMRARGGDQIRVAAVFPEPTPYRAPLLDRVAALDEIDLSVIYAARHGRSAHVAGRAGARGRVPAGRARPGREAASCTTTTR